MSLDLFTCNRHQLRRLLQAAWAHCVAEGSSHRNSLHEGLLPNPSLTGKLLQQLSPPEAMVIARHISGGFQSGATKSLWEPQTTDKCQLCGQLDTKEHRILSCPSTQHVRDRWAPYVSFAVGTHQHWIHGPFAVVPRHVEVPRLVLSRRPMPSFHNPVALDVAASLPRLRIFTDGSCMNPQSIWGKLASWAVILDTSQSDAEIPTHLHRWRLLGIPPSNFIIIAQGGIPGEQSINRAETCALAIAAQFVGACPQESAEVLTDSSCALTEHTRVLQDAPCLYPDISNQLAQSFPHKLRVRKIKAHQDPSSLTGLALWEYAGNSFADISAKAALQKDHQFLLDFMNEIAEEEQCDRAALHLFHRFLLDLSNEEWRLKQRLESGPLEPHCDTNADPQPSTSNTGWFALTPTSGEKFQLPPFDKKWVLASNWHPFFTIPVWDYLSGLEWQPPSASSPGVAGVEILVDFVVTTACLPPIRNALGDGYVKVLESPLHAPTTIRAWVQAFLEASRPLSRFCQATLLPKKRTKVFCLKTLGSAACRSGLQQRPRWRNPAATVVLLRKVLAEDSILPLIHYVQQSSQAPPQVDPVLEREYKSYSNNERDRLARKLRGGRGRCAV